MKTINELNNEILKTISIINDDYPELTKYIDEMPQKNYYEMDAKISYYNLDLFNEALDNLWEKYAMNLNIPPAINQLYITKSL